MVQTEKWVPGAVTAGVSISLPTNAPGIARIAGAYILRAMGQSLTDHAAVSVVASVADHAAHGHDLTTVAPAGAGSAVTEPAIAGDAESAGGGQLNTGAVDVLAADQAHATTGVAIPAHVLGAAATPVVAAVATRTSRSTLTLNVNTLSGDVLVLRYLAEGYMIQS